MRQRAPHYHSIFLWRAVVNRIRRELLHNRTHDDECIAAIRFEDKVPFGLSPQRAVPPPFLSVEEISRHEPISSFLVSCAKATVLLTASATMLENRRRLFMTDLTYEERRVHLQRFSATCRKFAKAFLVTKRKGNLPKPLRLFQLRHCFRLQEMKEVTGLFGDFGFGSDG